MTARPADAVPRGRQPAPGVPRWEYLQVYFRHTFEETGDEPRWVQHAELWWPPGDDEERRELTDRNSRACLLNELGATGWELVSFVVYETFLLSAAYGVSDVGSPISAFAYFKRPVS